ncbi:flavo protein [Patellaria atrata CBS 101060]|uniref:Flavo protein n=1 Tax=Patellaria atrata CBS 101060 TaxID=1346257 RepID=A0A9P4SFC7_9PEZI|nr:flavo protein [Patellaria atrata CBS 101060]
MSGRPLPLPLNASEHINDGKYHLLLAASGSVASIKIPHIISALSRYRNISIRLVLTQSASQFLAGQSAEQPSLSTLGTLPHVDGIYLDEDEWSEPWVRGNKILHIELRKWADLLLIAPLSANSLAKMVYGISDNLLLSVIRAWDTTGEVDPMRYCISSFKKIIIVAPAMNTAMWVQPVTKQHIRVLESDWNVNNGGWVQILRPTEKELACGDSGSGAMADWNKIVECILQKFTLIA